MRRVICGLPLCLLLSCALAPDSSSRSDVSPAPHTPADPPEPIDATAPLPDDDTMEELARTDPVAFLRQSLARCEREVQSYRATLAKQERVAGSLLPPEQVKIWFRESPFSVRMDWEKGARLARRTLYVAGENDDQLLVVGNSWRSIAGVVRRPPDGPDARSSSRYPITEFGIKIGTQRALNAWLAARRRGDLDVRFHGTVTPPELGGRPCWKLQRVAFPAPEDDGVTEATFFFDRQTWLQVGSLLTGEQGRLVASYYFRDLELNPAFEADTFTRAGLRK